MWINAQNVESVLVLSLSVVTCGSFRITPCDSGMWHTKLQCFVNAFVIFALCSFQLWLHVSFSVGRNLSLWMPIFSRYFQPVQLFVGAMVVTLLFLGFVWAAENQAPVRRFRRNHPSITVFGILFTGYLFMSVLGGVAVFLFGVAFPILSKTTHTHRHAHQNPKINFYIICVPKRDKNWWKHTLCVWRRKAVVELTGLSFQLAFLRHALSKWSHKKQKKHLPPLCLTIVVLVHASLRLRSLKNKMENKLESIGLKRTPMGLLLEALGQEQEAGS